MFPEDGHLASGYWVPSGCYSPDLPIPPTSEFVYPVPQSSSIFWSLQDSELRGGGIIMGQPYHSSYWFPPGSVSWVINAFVRVLNVLDPTDYADAGAASIDLPFDAYNNMFRGRILYLTPTASSARTWACRCICRGNVTR